MVLSLIFFCSKKLTSQMVIINFCIFHISVHKALSIFLHNGKQPAFFVQLYEKLDISRSSALFIPMGRIRHFVLIYLSF